MKAITIRQPWAQLIVEGKRPYEIRTWVIDCPQDILVHSSKKVDTEACQRLGIDPSPLPIGSILGWVTVVECIRFTEESWLRTRAEHLEWTAFDPNVYGWVLRDPRLLPHPVPWRGSLGLFDVPDDVISGSEPLEFVAAHARLLSR